MRDGYKEAVLYVCGRKLAEEKLPVPPSTESELGFTCPKCYCSGCTLSEDRKSTCVECKHVFTPLVEKSFACTVLRSVMERRRMRKPKARPTVSAKSEMFRLLSK